MSDVPLPIEPADLAGDEDLEHSPDALMAPIPLAARVPNFCNGCGCAWQPHWTQCPSCARQHAGALPTDTPVRERSVAGLSLSLYFTLLGASVVGLVWGALHSPTADVLMGLIVAHSIIVLIWVLVDWREVVPALAQPFAPGWLALAVVGAGCTFLLATAILAGLHQGLGVRELRVSDGLLQARHGWPFIVLIVCVQPAIFEELAFRGVILRSLQPTLAPREAVAVSALLFMTLHLTLGSFPHLFVLGAALGYLRVRTGSLLPCMLMHFTHNLLCVWSEHGWALHAG